MPQSSGRGCSMPCCSANSTRAVQKQEQRTSSHHALHVALQEARVAAEQPAPPAPELPQALEATPFAEPPAAPPVKAPATERADAKEEGSAFSLLVRTRTSAMPCMLRRLCELAVLVLVSHVPLAAVVLLLQASSKPATMAPPEQCLAGMHVFKPSPCERGA